jgi:CRP-like cAMP-binding protein
MKNLGSLMYEFMSDQLLGISGLINLSNIIFLVAFSVRDVLKLRILAIVGEGLTLPYYYFQNEKLWPPMFWGVAFMIVNAIRVVAIALEQRPVVLCDREEKLYRVAFSSIDKREFLKLASLARWADYSPGEVILEKGQQISEAIVVIAGDLEVVLGGNSRMTLRPGQLVGDVSAYSGLASPANVVARSPGTLAKWELRQVREFTASRPGLRASLLQMVSVDLAVKLSDIANTGLSSAAGKPVAK